MRMKCRRIAARIVSPLVACAFFLSALPSYAQSTTGSRIDGTVVAQATGLPVSGANVTLFQGQRAIGVTRTDAQGRYAFLNEPSGSYTVGIAAQGFQPTRTDTFFVVAGQSSTALYTALIRAASGSSNLREIGRVTASARGQGLQTTTVIHSDLDAPLLQSENYVRVGDALNTLPGVNVVGQSSALGDDLYADIRGVGANETQTLIDGHPIGPIGAAPGTFFNGVPSTFDYQDSPTYALRNVQVTYGSGALGLYGTDSIGGTVDFQTLDPTRVPVSTFTQGVGNYGKSISDVQATGTIGKLGYALVHAVQGTYGNFAPQTTTQSGLLGNNLTASNIAANTYLVTANYLLRNDLLKLKYQLSGATSFQLTGYSGVSWDDKSGNGDNDFVTYDLQLYNAQQAAAGGPTSVTGANGQTFSCPNKGNRNPIAVVTSQFPNGTCFSVAQYASSASGPAGGGPSPWQAIRNQDYHGRLLTQWGKNLISGDVFFDNYAVDYNRNVAGGPCSANSQCNKLYPGANFLIGGFDTGFTRSAGYLVSDDLQTNTNDLGFGFFSEHQNLTQTVFNTTNTFKIASPPGLGVTVDNYFVRDVYTPPSRFSYFFNGWLKRSTVTDQTRFDPRLSIVFKPTAHDVIRLTGGTSTEAPAPALKLAETVFNTTPQNINPNCNGLTEIGTSGNPNITSETGGDVELAYGHSFRDDSTVQVDFYNTNLANEIF
ncbi:MAG: TonB-dependent receptor, partial [Candidatus Eremiobacteraeota bacterium]|nr:TonB-dependent receptor [Candidatus Eremiobacteraeota bacterium]